MFTTKSYDLFHFAESGKDSFMMLESRFQKAGQVILRQENEISELYSVCRQLQKVST